MLHKIIFCCGFLLLTPFLSAATVEQALYDYQSGNFESAFKYFNELAALGNTKAQFNVGVMYARGEFVKPDYAKSWAWFQLTKFNRGMDVENVVAILEEKMDAAKKEEARVYFEALKRDYSNQAIESKYLPSSVVNDNSAFQPAKVLIKTRAKYPVGMLRNGVSGVVDLEYMIEKDGSVRYPSVLASTNRAFSDAAITAVLKNRYEPASIDGKVVHEYGRRMRFIFEMQGAEIDYRRVDRIFNPLKEKAKTGGGQDKYQYAYTISMIATLGYHLDEDNKMELENPNEWFSKSAQDGFSPAKYELGKRLAYGSLCAVNTSKALFWLEQAAEQNLAEAQMMLGLEYLSGARAEKDTDRGHALIKKAAMSGYQHAVLRYALIVSSSPELDEQALAKAKEMLDTIKLRDYDDKLSFYEAAMALHYALGEKKQALKLYKKGVKEAKRYAQQSTRLEAIAHAIEKNTRYIEVI